MPLSADSAPSLRLTSALPEWAADTSRRIEPQKRRCVIGVLPGEGVGPEVTAIATDLLRQVAALWDLDFEIRLGGAIGTAAERAHGQPLTAEVVSFCEAIFADDGAILCGPGGGRFVYDLRARFDLFCKFTPVRPLPALRDTGVLRPDAVADVDLVVVRENASGLYFGEGRRTPDAATHSFCYRREEISRIVAVAIRLAQRRRRQLTLVVKQAAVREVSELWREIFDELTREQALDLSCLEVDNANYQIIANARAFDVVLAPNLFGDILSDGAALLLGSRGMSFSGNFGAPGVAVYQTGHGAAHDLAGQDRANPIGQILSATLLLRESFGLEAPAAALEAAVAKTLGAGLRTADIAAPGRPVVGTREMGRAIAGALERETAPVPITA